MSIEKQNEVYVSDGKGGKIVVRPGDKVTLLPPKEGDEEEGYLSKKHHDFLQRFLDGPGHYEISWIGLWPCGRAMLYLKLTHGREPGAHASEFQWAA